MVKGKVGEKEEAGLRQGNKSANEECGIQVSKNQNADRQFANNKAKENKNKTL